jgi:chemotaxis protein MotA
MVSYPLRFFTKIPGHLRIILRPTKYNPREYITSIVELAKVARRDGILALQDKVETIEDVFFKNSLNLVIDAIDAEKVKTLMENELDYMEERHPQDRAFYAKGSSYSPAFGMIGTLIGLVNLLQNLSEPDEIAPAISVALVTTFYGTMLSNLFFAPISNKLKVRHDEEYLCKMIVYEGVQAIQAGDSPRFIEEKLVQLLPSKLSKLTESGGEKEKGAKKAKKTKAKPALSK